MEKSSDKLLSKLFFSMLPVQILIFAMGSINTLIDGAMAGRYIGSDAIGVIGLYYSMVNFLNATGSVLLGGTAVISGSYMGKGDLKKTEGVFSLNLTVTFLAGAVLTIVSLLVPGPIALLLGSGEAFRDGLTRYITGYAVGIIPLLLAQQIAAFLQMERQNARGYIGIAGMILSNIAFDILFVGVWQMGIHGLALATSLSNLVYFLLLVPYYFSPKAQLHYGIKKALWQDLSRMIGIGFPGAVLVFCLAARGMIVNRILLRYAGSDGISALSSYNMVAGFFLAYCLGNGSVLRMLISIFMGEEDRASIKKILHIVLTKALFLAVCINAVILVVSPFLTDIFFPDRTSQVYHLAHQLFVIYSFCIPFILICQVITNYFQTTGHNAYVNVQSVFDGLFAMVIPALLLAPFLGALGVWIANPIGIVLTILTAPAYVLFRLKRIPKTVDEWLLLPEDFGVPAEDVLDIPVRSMEDVSRFSAEIQAFCEKHGVGKSASMYAALCMEEMAGNVVSHGFRSDNKSHSLNVMTICKNGGILLRIKDDCIPFNPVEMWEMVSEEKSVDSIGIRMVFGIADDVNYQNLLKLNVLTISIKGHALA